MAMDGHIQYYKLADASLLAIVHNDAQIRDDAQGYAGDAECSLRA